LLDNDPVVRQPAPLARSAQADRETEHLTGIDDGVSPLENIIRQVQPERLSEYLDTPTQARRATQRRGRRGTRSSHWRCVGTETVDVL